MLSINTGKNQISKIRGALYIPTYEYNYKVITRCDTILQEYYITDGRKCENTKRYIRMNSTKGAHELHKENSRDEQGALRDRSSDGLLMIHASAAPPDQQPGEFIDSKLQDLDMRIQGSQKLPNEWCGECQVACRNKHTCINKSELKDMH